MRQELLEILEAVREEEREILEEGAGIRKDLYTEGDPFIVTARKMMGDDQKLIQIRTHTRFIAFPRHRHDFIEMMYVCKGSCTHIIDGQEITVQAGEFLLLNQYSWHEIKKAEKDDISVNFVIRPEFFDKPYTMLGFNNAITDFLINVLRKNSSQGEFLYFQVADAVPVQNLIENMVFMLIHDQENDLILQTTMGLLCMQLAYYTDRLNRGVQEKFDDMLVKEEHGVYRQSFSACQSDGAGGQAASVAVFAVKALKRKDRRDVSGDGAEQEVLSGAGTIDGVGSSDQRCDPQCGL